MLHQRALPRYELEDLVSELSFSYPKCFSQINSTNDH
jgi:hypothetical protein